MQWEGDRAQEWGELWQSVCRDLPKSRSGSWRIFVKKIQSLSFLATLAIVIGMISWGSALNAQSTPSSSDQQPQTQQPPSPEMPPAAQQAPSAQTPSTQTPSSSTPESSQSPSSQTPSNPPSSTPDQSAQPPASQAPSSQTPSAQPPASSTPPASTPDATAPESGSKTANPAGSAASSSPEASQTFSGTVVKQGDKYVLKDDSGKTYDIDHQTDVAKFEGKRVRVQGTLDPNGKILVK